MQIKFIDGLMIDKNMSIEAVDENGLIWLNPNQIPFKLIGFYWFEQDKVFEKNSKDFREACKKIEIKNVERCQAAGDNNIHFIDAECFQGEDFWECTVDGAHPTDLGFYRMAENLLPEIVKRLV